MDKDIRTGTPPYKTVPLRIVEPLHLPLHLFPRSCRSWPNEDVGRCFFIYRRPAARP
jgi:hypothetical protein